MDVRTALGVEYKRREAEEAAETALKAAAEAEEAAMAEESGTERPSAKERFSALGKRIIALADDKEALGLPDGTYTGDLHTGAIELGVEGLAIAIQAREDYTPGGLRGRELNYLNIEWRSSAYAADTPLARQKVSLSEVREHNVTPEVLGMLRLMEKSVSAAEFTREGATVA